MNMQAKMEATPMVNGLDMNAAMQTIVVIKANPDLAQFQFRAHNH